jgi:hypothetical protein
MLSPVKIRKLMTARALLGSTLSFVPAWKIVDAVVVRTIAFVVAVRSSVRMTIGSVSQRIENNRLAACVQELFAAEKMAITGERERGL